MSEQKASGAENGFPGKASITSDYSSTRKAASQGQKGGSWIACIY